VLSFILSSRVCLNFLFCLWMLSHLLLWLDCVKSFSPKLKETIFKENTLLCLTCAVDGLRKLEYHDHICTCLISLTHIWTCRLHQIGCMQVISRLYCHQFVLSMTCLKFLPTYLINYLDLFLLHIISLGCWYCCSFVKFR
jgi:hypothetical protein